MVLDAHGGGSLLSIKRAIHGRVRFTRTLIAGSARRRPRRRLEVARELVNGHGSVFFDREGRLAGVMILDVAKGQIQAVS